MNRKSILSLQLRNCSIDSALIAHRSLLKFLRGLGTVFHLYSVKKGADLTWKDEVGHDGERQRVRHKKLVSVEGNFTPGSEKGGLVWCEVWKMNEVEIWIWDKIGEPFWSVKINWSGISTQIKFRSTIIIFRPMLQQANGNAPPEPQVLQPVPLVIEPDEWTTEVTYRLAIWGCTLYRQESDLAIEIMTANVPEQRFETLAHAINISNGLTSNPW